jgi:hypothetical protein
MFFFVIGGFAFIFGTKDRRNVAARTRNSLAMFNETLRKGF